MFNLDLTLSPPSAISKNQSQMDSSSTPNVDNNQFEGDEKQEFLTPDSRDKSKQVVSPDRRGKRKESPEASGETMQTQRTPRFLPPRSKIWGHFTRTKESRDKCICHYCNKTFCCATRSGTSNLLKHLSICKRFMLFSEGQSSTQPSVNEEGKMKSRKISDDTFREATNEMMVIAELPLSFIEGAGWKHFCNKMELGRPVSRRTSTRDIVKMYLQRKAAMKQWFKANKQRVSLTTDIWVAQVTLQATWL
ncbi:uncharacterized protein LOC108806053 isoform X2 [Raphanus sativus]|uniref:Uncharacterized protein LOC108806053 isoform X2 n=1 Tax=Raphanus sativus TaxID=3726 RepID=A0A6J0JFD6_RAPSA|nr:uncharacterized protein LOC108806053 isoform X2 [Raphanus sativus]